MRRLIAVVLLGAVLGGCGDVAARTGDVADEAPDVAAMARPAGGFGGGGAGGPAAAAAPVASASLAAVPGVAAPAATDQAAAPVVSREVIYTAALEMTVGDIAAAEASVRGTALAMGGYLDSLSGNEIAVRVPAARFEDARAAIERLGHVTSRNLKADDITDQMRDLRIRLDNAEQVRKQLQALLEKSEKMEDTLKIEKELERVTEEVELLKGKIQYLGAQVAFSTLRVTFNSVHPQTPAGGVTEAVPFAWVRDLASGPIGGITEESPDTSRLFHRNDRFKLPTGFVRYYEREHLTELVSADGCYIKMRRVDNYDGGTIDFWMTLARSTLSEGRAIALGEDHAAKLGDGTAARVVTGVRDPATGGAKQSYMLCLAATDRYVYAFEAWGPGEKLEPRLGDIEKAFTTLDAKRW